MTEKIDDELVYENLSILDFRELFNQYGLNLGDDFLKHIMEYISYDRLVSLLDDSRESILNYDLVRDVKKSLNGCFRINEETKNAILNMMNTNNFNENFTLVFANFTFLVILFFIFRSNLDSLSLENYLQLILTPSIVSPVYLPAFYLRQRSRGKIYDVLNFDIDSVEDDEWNELLMSNPGAFFDFAVNRLPVIKEKYLIELSVLGSNLF